MRVGPYDASGNPAAAGDDVVGLRRLRAMQKFGLGRIGGDGCRNVRQEQGTVKLAHPGFVTVTDDVRTESRGLAGVDRRQILLGLDQGSEKALADLSAFLRPAQPWLIPNRRTVSHRLGDQIT
jgi:hypothetical protein